MISKVTICVLAYGDYPKLARRSIESIRARCPRTAYCLVVGANAVGTETLDYLKRLEQKGEIDRLIVSSVNVNKCPLMRQMFQGIETEFIWWFDDDSFILKEGALSTWLELAANAPASTVNWGEIAWCGTPAAFTDVEDAVGFVRTAKWYRGLSPPSWRVGGKGELDFGGCGTGDGRWIFILGGCWLIRTSAVRILDWPDKRLIKLGDDVFLGEAIRQQGWHLAHIENPGVAVNTEPRRGDPGPVLVPRPMINSNQGLPEPIPPASGHKRAKADPHQ